MAISPNYLVVKISTIPGSGKGLFTKKFIPAGTRIAEYTGKVSAWKDANHEDGDNGYIYYVKRSHVIDAKADKTSIARYANDARGLTRVKGITNNCEYVEEGTRVYIHAKKDIEAGSEILVPYGPEYWQVIRYNRNLASREATSKEKEAKKKTAREKAARKKTLKEKSGTSKKTVNRSSVSKSSVNKSTVNKPSVSKSSDNKPSVGKASVSKSSDNKPSVSKASVSKSSDNKPSVSKAVIKPSVTKSSVSKTSGERLIGVKKTREKITVEKIYKRRA